jgi:hypothetical protein
MNCPDPNLKGLRASIEGIGNYSLWIVLGKAWACSLVRRDNVLCLLDITMRDLDWLSNKGGEMKLEEIKLDKEEEWKAFRDKWISEYFDEKDLRKDFEFHWKRIHNERRWFWEEG